MKPAPVIFLFDKAKKPWILTYTAMKGVPHSHACESATFTVTHSFFILEGGNEKLLMKITA